MRPSARAFYTQLELPCTVLCGPDAARKLSGTAITIEPESVLLQICAGSLMFPRVGERVGLEVHLPGDDEVAGAKDLSIRGLIVEVTEMRDGARQVLVNFRRAHFKDRNGTKQPKKRKAGEPGWEM
jgi:hypothetical protein